MGKWLYEARRVRGLQLIVLSEKLGIDCVSLSKMETLDMDIPEELIPKLSEVLCMPESTTRKNIANSKIQNNTWYPIGTVPRNETAVLIGHYFTETDNGYFGDPKWLWIISGSFDDEFFYDDYTDEEVPASEMLSRATHWKLLCGSPNELQN